MDVKERLVKALELAEAPAGMIEAAKAGYYGDFTSPLDMPITQLVEDARANGLGDIGFRAMRGDFDGE